MKIDIKKAAIFSGMAAAIAAGTQAHAQQPEISYDYLEAAASKGELLDEDFTGYGVAGSFSITESVFMRGSYSNGTSDDEFRVGFMTDEIELSTFTFGLGYHLPISSSTDFVSNLSYISGEVDFGNADEDANGYIFDIGLRSMVMPNLELEGLVAYTDGSDSDGDVSFEANAKFFVTPAFALILGYSDGDDTSGLAAGIRLNF